MNNTVTELRTNVPKGKFRVIRVDPLSGDDFPTGDDHDTKESAFVLADTHNAKRVCETQDVYYVYDHEGDLLRGWKDVTNAKGETVGVCP